MKNLSTLTQLLAAAPVWATLTLLRLLPLTLARKITKSLAQTLGVLLPVSEHGLRNLRLIFPTQSDKEHRQILKNMWKNFGLFAAEQAHLDPHSSFIENLIIEGEEIITAAKNSGKPVVFISAHLGNWEVLPFVARRFGLAYAGVYRPANNRFVDRLFQRSRGSEKAVFIPKGKQGTRQLLAHVRQGKPVGMLIDQRLSHQGARLPFLGHETTVTTTPAELCLRFKALLIPACAVRQADGSIKVIIEQSLQPGDVPQNLDHAEAVQWLTIALNKRVEEWIYQYPEQWLWLHRRWR